MTRSTLRTFVAAVLLAATTVSLSAAVSVQRPTPATTPSPVQPEDPTRPTTAPRSQAKPVQPPPQTIDDLRRQLQELEAGDNFYRRPALRVGQDYALRAGETVGDVTVVFGNARIEGRIRRDLVVIMGNAHLGATAVIEGSFVVVGGEANIEPGAMVRRDVVTVGTSLNAPGDFIFAGEHIVIGNAMLGNWMRSVTPWVTYGLLWGRPIVPSIGWVWTIIFAFFVVYLLVNLLLHEPVRATADVLARRPFGTFLTGLLVLLLWAPISALLAVSVVGIIVIPFFLSALVVAAVVGRVGVARWIGNSLIAPDDPSSRVLALRSFVFGFVLLTLTYMVPVLGFVAWGLVGVFGLGAAVMAFLAAWRKETPPKATPAVPPAFAPSELRRPSPEPSASSSYYAAVEGIPAIPVVPSAPALAVSVVRATFLERAMAFGLDVLLVAVVHEGLEGTFFPRYAEMFFPLLMIYFIAFWTWKGTTVGGIVLKLRVIKTTGAPIEAADAIVRALAGVLSFAALGIGVLWILRDPERQAWHDKAVGTWVVKESVPVIAPGINGVQ
jgi:uncharacterized RDD family membrane protein YckC